MTPDSVVILLVIAAVALVIGPVYWLMPSTRQRQLARLRAQALALGLRPALRSVPAVLQHSGYPAKMIKYQWFRPEADWPADGPTWLAFYQPADGRRDDVEPGDKARGDYVWLRSEGYSAGPDRLLRQLRDADFPPGHCALEASAAGVGCFWHEAGDNRRVLQLKALLEGWLPAYRDGCAETDAGSVDSLS